MNDIKEKSCWECGFDYLTGPDWTPDDLIEVILNDTIKGEKILFAMGILSRKKEYGMSEDTDA